MGEGMLTKDKNRRSYSEKTLRKLWRKKLVVVAWLNDLGFEEISETTEDVDILNAAYAVFELDPISRVVGIGGRNSRYGYIVKRARLSREVRKKKLPKSKPQPPVNDDEAYKRFYRSGAWRQMRYQIIQRDGARCLACGASPGDGIVLNVDHIKPLKKYWNLRLDPENLQTLCNLCNHGKGNWDETDWR